MRSALLGLVCCVAGFSHAACSVNATGVTFGNYDPFSNQNLDGTGNVGITCDAATPYSITLSAGTGSYLTRTMANGAHLLAYNLYTDATRTTVWGDGTASTAAVNGSGASVNHTVYGRIPARQNVQVGTYADAITVVVNF
jgi:spore coat protein U-like protein